MTKKPKTRKAPAAKADAPEDVKLTADLAGTLHWPARKSQLESLEEHVTKAAHLSRALWELLGSDDFTTDDKRSVNAVIELASAVADHTSAAEFIFGTSE